MMITISILEFILFVVAWLIAHIILYAVKAILQRRQYLKLVDEVYLKVSKLIVASVREFKEVAKNVQV